MIVLKKIVYNTKSVNFIYKIQIFCIIVLNFLHMGKKKNYFRELF